MSADQYSRCPKCDVGDLDDEDTLTFREYFEIGIWEGKFLVSYQGSCDVCDYEFTYNKEVVV